jgi:hypothetical protein
MQSIPESHGWFDGVGWMRLEKGMGVMSAVYNPESDTMAEIERLELEARDIRRRIERASNEEDRRVLDRQLKEIGEEVELLQARLP